MKKEAALEPRVTPFNVVFCDDVRREVSGKDILVGAYSGDITVQSVPTTIGIAFWIQVRVKGIGTVRTRLRVTDPAGNTAGEAIFDQLIGTEVSDAASTETTAAVILPQLLISVVQTGTVTVYWAVGDGEYALIGAKAVRIGVLASAPGPSATRSSPAASA